MNIVLIGMMGCGKSVVGKELAIELNLDFIDTDLMIVEKHGKISDIFSEKGEEYFRKIESEEVKQASQKNNAVISTGGGVVLNKENIDFLKNNAVILYLQAKPETLFERTAGSDRPLLGSGGLEKIKNILEIRSPLYEKYAEITVSTDNLCIPEIVKIIENKLK